MSGGEPLQRAQIAAEKGPFSSPASSSSPSPPPVALFAKIADFYDNNKPPASAVDRLRRRRQRPVSDGANEGEEDGEEREEAKEREAAEKEDEKNDEKWSRNERSTGNIAQFLQCTGAASSSSSAYGERSFVPPNSFVHLRQSSSSSAAGANIGPGNENSASGSGSGRTSDRCPYAAPSVSPWPPPTRTATRQRDSRHHDDVNNSDGENEDDDDNDDSSSGSGSGSGATFLPPPAVASSSRAPGAPTTRHHLSSFSSPAAAVAAATKAEAICEGGSRRAGVDVAIGRDHAHGDNRERRPEELALGGGQETVPSSRLDDSQANAKQQPQQYRRWHFNTGQRAESAIEQQQTAVAPGARANKKGQEQEEEEEEVEHHQAMGKRLGRPASLEVAVSSGQQRPQQQQLVAAPMARPKRAKRARTPAGDNKSSVTFHDISKSNCEPSLANSQQQQQVSRSLCVGGKSASGQLQSNNNNNNNHNNNNNGNSKCSLARPGSSSAGASPQRPASAMAGGGSRSPSSSQVGSSREPSPRPASKQSSSSNLLAATTAATTPKMGSNNSSTTSSSSRTTRVRINSTSEQIQDPNWLIEMSKGYKSASSGKNKFHLKSLQAKLKSTIGAVGGTSGSGGGSSSNRKSSSAADSAQSGPSDIQGACATPPMPPSTPVKVPVSILKQPASQQQRASAAARLQQMNPSNSSTGPAAQLTATSHAFQAANSNHSSAAIPSTSALANSFNSAQAQSQARSPARSNASSTSTSGAGNSNQVSQQQQQGRAGKQPKIASSSGKQSAARQSPASSKSAALLSIQPSGSTGGQPERRSGSSASDEDVGHMRGSSSKTSSDQQQQQPHSSPGDHSAPRPKPICADGQVKVSGWKRNNLLAKTLSHFDEIRGNQRPIFMPTKIRLPSEALPPTRSGSPPAPSGSQGNAAGSAKFADIVREAITKKSLLKESQQQQQQQQQMASATPASGSAGAHLTPSGLAPKRASDAGERQLAALHQRPDTSASSHGGSFHLGRDSSGSGGTAGSPAKRPFSADPGRSLTTPPSNAATPIKKPQILTTSPANSAGASHQHGHQHQHQHQKTPSMADIIAAAVAAHADQHQHGSPSSSRAFKLQLKNEQVLQNLRRQSNEMAREALMKEQHQQNSENCAPELTSLASSSAGTSAASHSRAGSHSSARSSGSHLKDWKRLSNKLSLLTGRGGARSATCTPPNGSSLAAAAAGANNPMSLRMTLSNQESASQSSHRNSHEQLLARSRPGESGKRRSGSGSNSGSTTLDPGTLLLVPPGLSYNRGADGGDQRRQSNQLTCSNSASAAGERDREERRKLSSSSMIAVPVSATAHLSATSRLGDLLRAAALSSSRLSADGGRRLMCRSAANSPMDLSTKELQTLRRSSDSSACRSQANGEKMRSATGSRGNLASGQQGSRNSNADLAPTSADIEPSSPAAGSAQSSTQSSGQQRKPIVPIVVHRDDLIRLLQVNANGDETTPTPPPLPPPLGTSATDLAPARADTVECSPSYSRRTSRDKTQTTAQVDSVVAEEKDDKQQEWQQQEDYRLSADKIETCQIGPPITVAGAADGARPSSNAEDSGDKSTNPATTSSKTDLSSLVKRTSKVAYFQQKLRKMRWHSKQQQQQSKLEKQQQQQQQQHESAETLKSKLINDNRSGVTDGANVKNQLQQQQKHQRQPGQVSSGSGADILMDPNLIGDAIETFLRTTMQQQQQQQRDESEDETEQVQGNEGLQEVGRNKVEPNNNEADGGGQSLAPASTHIHFDKCVVSNSGSASASGGLREEPSENRCAEQQNQQQQQRIQATSS